MPDSKNDSLGSLWTIVALLVFLILLLLAYKLKDFSTPDVTAIAPLDSSCDLRKGKCWSELPNGGKVSFSIMPKDIPVLAPLELMVTTEAVDVSTVELDFVGINMDMGYNHTKLERTGRHHFKGTAIIPVCVRDKMVWEARILLQTDTGLLMAPFRFYTLK